MKFPTDLFLQGIAEKKVYYFSSDKISADTRHHFICIKKTDKDVLILSCCTSKFNTVKNFVERRGLPKETLVFISPSDDQNPFDKDTYVNCNDCFEYTVEEFRVMYESDKIDLSGEIKDSHYEQILIGLQKSPLIDEDLKKILPKSIDDL